MDEGLARASKPQLARGVIDAGIASLATFMAGLAGVRLLDDAERGIYGVFFTAFLLGSVVIAELVLVPAQVIAVGLPRAQRLSTLRRGLILALVPSVLGVLAAPAAAAWTGNLTSPAVITALVLTTAVTIVVSPLQDHVRQLLHIADLSQRAVLVSIAQLIGVVASLGVFLALDVPRAWLPFGSLAIANTVSLGFGIILAGGLSRSSDTDAMTLRHLSISGRWLVVRAAVPAAFGFVAANILTQIAGPVVYGHAEAARQIAQPVTVLAIGLASVMGPRAVRSGSLRDHEGGASNRRRFVWLITLGTLGYVGLAGFDWWLNPMAVLVPAAYVVGGLVIATIIANWLAAVFLIYARELLGAGHARALAMLALIASPSLPLAALTAGSIEAFARPLGYVLEGSIRVIGGKTWLAHHYGARRSNVTKSDQGIYSP